MKDKQQDSSSRSGKDDKPVKWTNNASAQASQPRNRSEGNEALAGLGIEFAPPNGGAPSRMTGRDVPAQPKPKTFSLNEIMQKGENVPFNNSKTVKKERKEVDLADLRKALEDSLVNKPKTPEEELEQRVQEEKSEDKTSFPNQDK
jgi:hypothetical protein